MKHARQEYDFAFRRYLEREHSLCVSGNTADYKPTYTAELDELTKNAIASFERACVLLDAMSVDERAQCKQAFLLVNSKVSSYSAEDMVSFFLENQDPNYKSCYGDRKLFVDYVGPRWLQAYVTYGKLRAMFEPEAPALPIVTGLSQPQAAVAA